MALRLNLFLVHHEFDPLDVIQILELLVFARLLVIKKFDLVGYWIQYLQLFHSTAIDEFVTVSEGHSVAIEVTIFVCVLINNRCSNLN